MWLFHVVTGALIVLKEEEVDGFIHSNEAKDLLFSIPACIDDSDKFILMYGEKPNEFFKIYRKEINDLMDAVSDACHRKEEADSKRRFLFSPETTKTIDKEFSTPCYILREDDFLASCQRLIADFSDVYADYRFAYSVKTNYAPYILSMVRRLGEYVEVVSDFELKIARRVGVPDNRIIYNGPNKGASALGFIKSGGLLNVDSIGELYNICVDAGQNVDLTYNLGIRLNIDIGQNFISRFGVSVQNGDFDRAITMIRSTTNVKLIGLHCHVADDCITGWKKRAESIIHIIMKYSLVHLKYIDLGSGMAIRDYYSKLPLNCDDIRTYKRYAIAALRPFVKFYSGAREKPTIFTEPGTLLIRNNMDFIVKVICIKEVDNQQFVIVDGSIHHLGNEAYLDYKPIQTVNSGVHKPKPLTNAIISGNTCIDSDYLYTGFSGELAEGDYLIFGDVGAYSVVKKPPFIHLNAGMISMSDGGNMRLLKRPDEFDDIMESYCFDA